MILDTVDALTFVVADPPRHSGFARWRLDKDTRPNGEKVSLHLAVRDPEDGDVRSRKRTVAWLGIGDAIDVLASAPPESLSESATAWRAALFEVLGLIARGRVGVSASRNGFDAWQVGPLDRSEELRMSELAMALPLEAHAEVVAGGKRDEPVRVHSSGWLVAAFADAVVDALVRTPAAALASGAALFASPDGALIDESLADAMTGAAATWLAERDRPISATGKLGLRLELQSGAEGPLTVVVQVTSPVDASLVVDAVDLFGSSTVVQERFSRDTADDVLLALRLARSVWPPAQRLLDQDAPDRIELTDDEADALLGPALDGLADAGFDVLLPGGQSSSLSVNAALSMARPDSITSGEFNLDGLVDFDWEVALDGDALSSAEVDALAEAKRPLVRVRGQWVLVEGETVEALRHKPKREITAGEALAAALGGEVVVDGEAVDATAAGPLAELAERLRDFDEVHELPEPPGLVAELRPYQRRGVAWLCEMAALGVGGCLADDMGLGKTIQLISAHLYRRMDPATAGPTLVVCPMSLLGNWERECKRFAPDVPVRRYHGGSRTLEDLADDEIVLVTYGVVRRDSEELADVMWSMVVADEAQHVKNPLGRTAKELRRIPAKARLALTGTPVENRLSELWALLDWTTPGLLGPLDRFRRTVAVPIERDRDPEVTRQFAELIRPFLLRRRKTDPGVLPDLPPKTTTDVLVGLTAEQVTLYEATVRETLSRISEAKGMARRGLVLQLLTRLKQVCNHPAQLLGQTAPIAGRSGKLDALDELVDTIIDAGDQVLVFTQYVAMGRLLERHFAARSIPTAFLHGGLKAAKREQLVDEFQAGKVPVFLLSLKAGGTGLNLTAATHVVHYDRWWNPAVEDQASDRAWRIGQDRLVQVHCLVSIGTLEERIAILLDTKRELADAVVGSGEGWLTELDDHELAELVKLDEQDRSEW